MTIRTEQKNDRRAVYDLIKTAFQTAKVSDGDEQDYMESLRQQAGFIPQLSLVAEEQGKIVGQAVLTQTNIERADGTGQDILLLLGPICVALNYRDGGIGKQLIETACSRAKEMGYGAVILVGDPAYYHKTGFVQADRYGIRHSSLPANVVLIRELSAGFLQGKEGTVRIV